MISSHSLSIFEYLLIERVVYLSMDEKPTIPLPTSLAYLIYQR